MAPGYYISQTELAVAPATYASQPSIIWLDVKDCVSSGSSDYPRRKKSEILKHTLAVQKSAFSSFYSKPVYTPRICRKNKKEPLQRIDKFKGLNENLII